MPVKIDTVSSTVQYIGKTPKENLTSDPVWEIIRITGTGDDTDIERPIEVSNKNGVWDDRTTYTYG